MPLGMVAFCCANGAFKVGARFVHGGRTAAANGGGVMRLTDIDPDLIEPQRLAGSTLDQARNERRRTRNPGPTLTAREALQAARFELQLAVVAIENVAYGIALNDADRARLILAGVRLEALAAEAGL